MEPITINSIQDLIEWNLSVPPSEDGTTGRFLYRGEAKTSYKLVPALFRDGEKVITDPTDRKNKLQDYLKIHLPEYGYDFHNYPPKMRMWRELFIGQHYGAPTNLLDFSRNPLVAAFFACNKFNEESDGKIYAVRIQEQNWKENNFQPTQDNYNIASYDLLSSENKDFQGWNPYELERSIFVVPPLFERRIQAQIGIFCCFSIEKTTISPLNEQKEFLNKEKNETGFIQEFLINKNIKNEILKELNRIGVNYMTIFPDLSGFGKFVSWKLDV